MDVVGAADREVIWHLEGKILYSDLVQIEGDDSTGVSNDSLELDGVDQWLGKGGDLERSVVETVNVVPD